MKIRAKLKAVDMHKEVVVTVSVRTNQSRMHPMARYESEREYNKVVDSIHGALRTHYHAREIQFVK